MRQLPSTNELGRGEPATGCPRLASATSRDADDLREQDGRRDLPSDQGPCAERRKKDLGGDHRTHPYASGCMGLGPGQRPHSSAGDLSRVCGEDDRVGEQGRSLPRLEEKRSGNWLQRGRFRVAVIACDEGGGLGCAQERYWVRSCGSGWWGS